MKVVIDRAIPYIEGIIERYAEVSYLPSEEITAASVHNADALIIRTRTKCNKTLLENSSVRFIATATIGTDHIDIDYCKNQGIEIYSAQGCNARGVLQWVSAALRHIAMYDNRWPKDYTLGVVGVGNVGSLVSQYARHWGFCVMECDPPRQEREGGEFYTIEEIARNCDIITLHTPLDATTKYLINNNLICSMRPDTTIINASRGGVVDNRAVLNSGHRYIFDVWEDEPNIPLDILNNATLATPHIAGYSAQGKANATAMCLKALARHFSLPLGDWYPSEVTPTTPRLISWDEMCMTLPRYFDIEQESNTLKCTPYDFEHLRNHYSYREEWY